MESTFKLSVNGQFVTKCKAEKSTSLGEFKAFMRTFKRDFDASIDTLEVECIDTAPSGTLPFQHSNLMLDNAAAVELQLRNLAATFGESYILEMANKVLKAKRVA